ncbi:MAG TPA: V-type ATPase 116kDa subunit family protein, partial [Ruminiclostridium sp.]|nr:V-type ATPase 116kDa subunit family protein [Ruminiclostridium sp.]
KQLQKAVDIAVHSDIPLGYSNFDNIKMSDTELEDYVEKVETEVGALNGKVRNLNQEIARLEQGIAQLSHIKSLKLSLDDIFTCKFFNFRFGRLPRDSFPKLEVCDEKDSVFFFPIEEDNEYFWGFYVALNDVSEKIDQLFTSLYFERINILEEAHGTPDQAISGIREKLDKIKAEFKNAQDDVSNFWNQNREHFLTVYSKLKYLSDSFDLRRYASKCGDNFYIFGWVAEKEAESFAKQFQKLHGVDCVVESIEEAENIEPPTKLINNRVTKPFESFTGMYGLPSYNEIDPTALMALTYTLFFGIMFGDLGQGIIILLVGIFCKAKKMMGELAGIFIRVGISSAIFGFLYNSVFGHENVLPFTILPVHDNSNVNLVLGSAVVLGIINIIICMVINIINGIKQKNPGKLFFDQNGLAGLVFYLSVIIGAGFYMLFNINFLTLPFILLLIILPLLIMFFKEPLTHIAEHKKEIIPGSKGEFFMTAFFEVFDILLSYFSNTISFIRIGAFILSHAGMMFAVFAIGNMFHTTGNIIAQIIGNVFVLCLEGLVVGIQGIRLHFYEMFSRFYEGEGKPFDPVKINYQ